MKPKPTIPDTFAARLRALRAEAGLTAYALAAKSGVSKQVVSKLESGAGLPSWGVACRLADALGVPLDALRGNGKAPR